METVIDALFFSAIWLAVVIGLALWLDHATRDFGVGE